MTRGCAHQMQITAESSGPIVRRCSCGGTCPACQEKQRQKMLRRSPTTAIPRGAHDFSSVPLHGGKAVRIGPANDVYEREADAVADRVVAGKIASPRHAVESQVQRAPMEEAATAEVEEDRDAAADASDMDEELEPGDTADEESGSGYDPTGQPKRIDGAATASGRVHLPIGASGGAPIDRNVRAPMEHRIGHDFSGVRVHTNDDSARAAAAIHARAFTVGSNIYFGAGSYQPSSRSGQHLLAHELTHVVQQSGGAERIQRQPKRGKRRRPTPSPTKAPPRRRRSTTPAARFCTVHGRRGKKPCGPSTCDGSCSKGTNPFTHNPCCGNETCGPSGAIDATFFIRHLDVNRVTQVTTAEWGTRTQTLAVSTFLTSPNRLSAGGRTPTPLGMHLIGEKCGACHTNGDGEGMAWLAGFDGIRIGFHNSQTVAKGVSSHGCVRAPGCACAKEIHDNTASGITSVCVHDGGHCKRPQPRMGAVDAAHRSVCGPLHVALPPAPKKAPGGGGGPVSSPPGRGAPPVPNAAAEQAREGNLLAAVGVGRDEELEG